MRFEEAVALAGGPADEELVEACLTPDGASAVGGTLQSVGAVMRGLLKQTPFQDAIDLVITNSPSLRCGVTFLDDRRAAIFIPLGALARARALARRLLWHLDQRGPVIHMMGSAMDVRDFPWEIAPDLVVVFGADAEEDPGYWDRLDAFDRRTPAKRRREEAVNDMTCHCLLFLALHELAHIAQGHDQLARLAGSGDPRIRPDLDQTRLRRGMEVQADILAGQTLARILLLAPGQAGLAAKRPDVVFGRSGFATAMLFGMYDTHRKTVYEYDTGIYPHPIIRYEFSYESLQHVLEEQRHERRQRVEQASWLGWQDCIVAFNAMEFACLDGMYGSPPAGTQGGTGRYIPLTTLKYGAASALRPRMIEDSRLADEVERIVETLGDEEAGGTSPG
ncbi:hypothetical protein F8568_002515 [Actinomadura sp. LD22]|uniref:Uncharacterized protein n=1 Tax=Actinomadura physcomitrii TaxID=2650748 RepID=A0A6I4M065_9ACTN|nr:hypothetical protein [Actinomadura physcomitrii]MVZ99277.1 hypothetical protein [Actinomadura physcomitrii]